MSHLANLQKQFKAETASAITDIKSKLFDSYQLQDEFKRGIVDLIDSHFQQVGVPNSVGIDKKGNPLINCSRKINGAYEIEIQAKKRMSKKVGTELAQFLETQGATDPEADVYGVYFELKKV